MKRITGRFTNSAGQLCYVNVYDTNYVGDPTELYMSTNPLTISEIAQDMLTEPIMASSAVLTFISDPALDGLVVSDEMQCRVEVTADSQLIWSGYLNPEVRDDLLPSITSEVTLNATSALGLMKTRKINPEGKAMCSIAEYIYEALNDCGCMLENICIPAVAKTDSSSGYNSLWTLTIQRDNFYTREDVTDTDEEQYDAQSWYDVLSNFMKLFGLTMREDYESGCVMLQSRSIGATYNTMSTYIFSTGEGTDNYTSPDRANMTDLSLWGTNHSISTYAPVKKVKVVSNVNTIESNLIDQDSLLYGPQIARMDSMFVSNVLKDNAVSKQNYYYLYPGVLGITDARIKLTSYSSDGTSISALKNIGADQINQYIADTAEFATDILGEHPVKAVQLGGAIPVWGTAAYRENSLSAIKTLKDSAKTIYMRNNTMPSYAGYDISKKKYLESGVELFQYKDDSLRLKGPCLISLYASFWKPDNGKKISPIKISLKVGDKYWQGSRWQSEYVTFVPEYNYTDNNNWEIKDQEVSEIIKLEFGEIKGLKMFRFNDDYLQGIELTIYINDSWANDETAQEFAMYDLTVACSQNTNNILKNEYTGNYQESYNTIAYRDNGGGTDIDPVEINVHSDNGYQQARSYLWNGSATINTLLYPGGTFTPERHLANLLKAIYCRTRKRYKLVTEGINYKGNTLYSYQGHDYCVVCKSVDPYRNTTTLVLEQAT